MYKSFRITFKDERAYGDGISVCYNHGYGTQCYSRFRTKAVALKTIKREINRMIASNTATTS
jgi:hypothetical protein